MSKVLQFEAKLLYEMKHLDAQRRSSQEVWRKNFHICVLGEFSLKLPDDFLFFWKSWEDFKREQRDRNPV
jgi:hypothetical protein